MGKETLPQLETRLYHTPQLEICPQLETPPAWHFPLASLVPSLKLPILERLAPPQLDIKHPSPPA